MQQFLAFLFSVESHQNQFPDKIWTKSDKNRVYQPSSSIACAESMEKMRRIRQSHVPKAKIAAQG
nr:MAG TPA: hypothetical protein [Caudoviricetes sp.]